MVQSAKARRIAGLSREALQRSRDRGRDWRLPGTLGEATFQLGYVFPLSVRPPHINRSPFAGESDKCLAAGLENLSVRTWRNRKTMIEVPGTEAPFVRIEAKHDFAILEDHAILIAEYREQHAALEVDPTSTPVDIEIGGEWRFLTPFEHIQPPGVVISTHAHMVRHEIEDQAHTMPMQRVDQCLEIRLAADLWVELVVVDDVIAMRRTGARLHDRRGVNMTDAECREIRNKAGCVAKREMAVKL